jgi:hypothetical protein
LDGNLLAKHAGQNFNKDKVFCDFDWYFLREFKFLFQSEHLFCLEFSWKTS